MNDWKAWHYALVAAAVTLVPVAVSDANGALFLAIGIAFASAIVLTVVSLLRSGRRTKSLLSSLALYALLAAAIFENFDGLHVRAKWLFHSSDARAQLAAERAPANGELRHVDWDGDGFAGLETETFLVFDPSDALAAFAGRARVGPVPGIGCEVDRVRELAPHYYAVRFYTETSWDVCG